MAFKECEHFGTVADTARSPIGVANRTGKNDANARPEMH